MLRATGPTVHRARKLRKDLSPAELRLWLALRDRPGDLKFRKQHPAGELSLDFYCAAAKLCVEVDGETHNRGDQPDFDPKRDAWLRLHGVETVRIAAADVFRNLDGVVAHLVETARLRLPLHRPAGEWRVDCAPSTILDCRGQSNPPLPPRSGEVKEDE